MKILACKASPEIIKECPEGLFKSPTGDCFMYRIDYTEGECLTITDTIGRILPLDITEIADIAEMLTRIVRYTSQKQLVEQFLLNELINVPTESDGNYF